MSRFRLPRRAPGDHTVDELRRVELIRVLLKIKAVQEAAAERAAVVDDPEPD